VKTLDHTAHFTIERHRVDRDFGRADAHCNERRGPRGA
jgi:hypothetical protein